MVALNHVNDFLRWRGSQEAYHKQLTNLFLDGHVSHVVLHVLTFHWALLLHHCRASRAARRAALWVASCCLASSAWVPVSPIKMAVLTSPPAAWSKVAAVSLSRPVACWTMPAARCCNL